MQSSRTPDTISLPFHSSITFPKLGANSLSQFLSLPLRLSPYLLTAVLFGLLFVVCVRSWRGRLALVLYNNQAGIHLATAMAWPSCGRQDALATNALRHHYERAISLSAVSSNAINAARVHVELTSEHNQFHCYRMFHVKHFFRKLRFLARKLAVFSVKIPKYTLCSLFFIGKAICPDIREQALIQQSDM